MNKSNNSIFKTFKKVPVSIERLKKMYFRTLLNIIFKNIAGISVFNEEGLSFKLLIAEILSLSVKGQVSSQVLVDL